MPTRPYEPIAWDEFLKAMAVVEVEFREKIPHEVFYAWHKVFTDERVTLDELTEKIENLRHLEIFGKVRINDFFRTERVHTEREVAHMIETAVTERVKQGRQFCAERNMQVRIEHADGTHFLTAEELGNADLEMYAYDEAKSEFLAECRRELEEQLRARKQQVLDELRARRQAVRLLSQKDRERLFWILVRRGVFKDDPKTNQMLIANLESMVAEMTADDIARAMSV